MTGHQEEDSEVRILRSKTPVWGSGRKDLHRLFEAFERIDEKTNRNIEGTGLGMAITANLLHMMDSNLQVRSVYGQGSTFYFDLKQQCQRLDPDRAFPGQG